MEIAHKLDKVFSKEANDDELCIFLSSKRGHYLALPADPHVQLSSFCGWLSCIELGKQYSLYKTLDNIYLSGCSPSKIINNFTSFERMSDAGTERFTLVKNGLIYEFEPTSGASATINIDLDFRGIFDNDDQGRIYSMRQESFRSYGLSLGDGRSDDFLLVEYTKYPDNSLNGTGKKHYLAIYGLAGHERVERWERRYYSYDSSRNSRAEYYIYKALRCTASSQKRILFSNSDRKEHAVSKLIDMLGNMLDIKKVHQVYAEGFLAKKYAIEALCGTQNAFAYVNSIYALDGLLVNISTDERKMTGLWAGLPWFFQFWARDEIISLRALMLERKNDAVKGILFRHLGDILPDGRIPGLYPSTSLGSADSIGWLFKRMDDFITYIEQADMLDDYLSLSDLKYVYERLRFSIRQLGTHHLRDGLVYNGRLETWMDTFYAGSGYEADFREGYRIEIEALYLAMLRLMARLDDMLSRRLVKRSGRLVAASENEYHSMEISMRERIREKFLTIHAGRNALLDGYDSPLGDVARPNIFLAYYIYPSLLSDREWEDVFDDAIERLWCSWNCSGNMLGGFATIDKGHPLYQPSYTGMDNKSYHRGDSWFYINNIAAICMHRLNASKYSQYISMIAASSSEDILFKGYIGSASELSSSGVFRPAGCFSQAWSMATYIELMHELYM